jgi:hypothetical protein
MPAFSIGGEIYINISSQQFLGNTMKKLIAIFATVFMTLSSQASLLSIDLDNTDYQVGDTLQANVMISDIEQDDFGFQKLLASFDFDLLFDSSLLAYQSTTFGTSLDVDPFFAGDQLDLEVAPGSLFLSELSFAFSNDLFAAQDGQSSFLLASVNFDVVSSGLNTFQFDNVLLNDDFGTEFSSVSTFDAEVIITEATSVPEVPSLAIFVLGLIALVARSHRA